jgi:Ureidoglycolate lyase
MRKCSANSRFPLRHIQACADMNWSYRYDENHNDRDNLDSLSDRRHRMTNPLHLPDERRSLGSVPNIQTLCITAQAFAPYGDLLVAPADMGRIDFVAKFENHRPHARTNIALVRCNSVAGQLRVDEMECHPFSSQTFLPLDVSDYLVVVALDDGGGRPNLSTLAAFRVNHQLSSWHLAYRNDCAVSSGYFRPADP